MTDKTELEVSQRARDAAAALLAGMNEGICEGRRDSLSVVQAFARFERDILTTRTPDPTPAVPDDGLVEALDQARRQLEYMDERNPSRTTYGVIVQIEKALAAHRGEA